MPDLVSFLKSTLNIDVVYASPWAKVNFHPEVSESLSKIAPEFGCAVGLAMRESK
jgi:Tfp pilus assembly PilM family ATPase